MTIVDSVADTPATLGGTLTLKFENGQVSITGSVSGFSANSNGAAHGFHIHETGSTANDCKAAGGHFNPDKVGSFIVVSSTPDSVQFCFSEKQLLT